MHQAIDYLNTKDRFKSFISEYNTEHSIASLDKATCTHIYAMCKRYKIDPGIVLNYYAVYQGRCNICRKTAKEASPSGRVQRLSIDHSHHNCEFRGVLCNNCNIGLGYFQDRPDLLQRAIAYLQKSQQSSDPVIGGK